jgi:hypothetical protein
MRRAIKGRLLMGKRRKKLPPIIIVYIRLISIINKREEDNK